MKTIVLAALALCTSSLALADADFTFNCNDCMVTRVTCRQASDGIDSGLLISISSGGFAGLTMANIAEQSIAGPRELGRVVVEVRTDSENHPGLVAYDGQLFNLVVNRGEENEGMAPARLQAQIGGRMIADDFVCRQL